MQRIELRTRKVSIFPDAKIRQSQPHYSLSGVVVFDAWTTATPANFATALFFCARSRKRPHSTTPTAQINQSITVIPSARRVQLQKGHSPLADFNSSSINQLLFRTLDSTTAHHDHSSIANLHHLLISLPNPNIIQNASQSCFQGPRHCLQGSRDCFQGPREEGRRQEDGCLWREEEENQGQKRDLLFLHLQG